MNLEIIVIAISALVLLYVVITHLRMRASVGKRAKSKLPARLPSVTVIRPIKGLDAGARENIRAALDHGYPGEVETLFVFDDDREPALPLTTAAIRDHQLAGGSETARVVFSGEPPAGRTGKLNAMIAGLSQAHGELIVFADSDIRPDKQALARLVQTLVETEGAGSAFAPVVVTPSPKTLGDAGYAMLINGMYGPIAARVAEKNGGDLPFIMGQFMVFKRAAIQAIGGLESAEGQLVDDMYLGTRVREAGYRNVVSPHPVPIIQEDMGPGEFWRTYVRWITFSRSGLPGGAFKMHAWIRGAIFWLGLLASVAAVASGLWWAALAAGLARDSVVVSNYLLHRALGGGRYRLRHALVPFGLLLIAPFVMLSVYFRREVNWRGRSYKLNGQSTLAVGRQAPADHSVMKSYG